MTTGTSESPQQIPNKKKKRHSFGSAPAAESHTTSPQRRHRRDWSISSNTSTTSNNGNPRSQQDEVQRKLDKAVAMESMFSSIHPTSLFSLIGDPSDDPGLPFSPIAPQSQWEAPGVGATYPVEEKLAGTVQRSSPALSQASFSSITSDKFGYSGSPLVHPLSPPDSTARMAGMVAPTQLSQKVHVQAATKEIDAMDVDPFYVPMPLQTVRPGIILKKVFTNFSTLRVHCTSQDWIQWRSTYDPPSNRRRSMQQYLLRSIRPRSNSQCSNHGHCYEIAY